MDPLGEVDGVAGMDGAGGVDGVGEVGAAGGVDGVGGVGGVVRLVGFGVSSGANTAVSGLADGAGARRWVVEVALDAWLAGVTPGMMTNTDMAAIQPAPAVATSRRFTIATRLR